MLRGIGKMYQVCELVTLFSTSSVIGSSSFFFFLIGMGSPSLYSDSMIGSSSIVRVIMAFLYLPLLLPPPLPLMTGRAVTRIGL